MCSLLEEEAWRVVLHSTCLILRLQVQRSCSRVVLVLLHDVACVSARLAQSTRCKVSDGLLSRERFPYITEGAQGLGLRNVGERLILGNAVNKQWYLGGGTLVNLGVQCTWSSLKYTSLANQLMLRTHTLA